MVQDGGAGAPGQARSTDRKALEPSTSDFRRGGLGPGGQGGPRSLRKSKAHVPFQIPIWLASARAEPPTVTYRLRRWLVASGF
jgi:hypothetical protein